MISYNFIKVDVKAKDQEIIVNIKAADQPNITWSNQNWYNLIMVDLKAADQEQIVDVKAEDKHTLIWYNLIIRCRLPVALPVVTALWTETVVLTFTFTFTGTVKLNMVFPVVFPQALALNTEHRTQNTEHITRKSQRYHFFSKDFSILLRSLLEAKHNEEEKSIYILGPYLTGWINVVFVCSFACQ